MFRTRLSVYVSIAEKNKRSRSPGSALPRSDQTTIWILIRSKTIQTRDWFWKSIVSRTRRSRDPGETVGMASGRRLRPRNRLVFVYTLWGNTTTSPSSPSWSGTTVCRPPKSGFFVYIVFVVVPCCCFLPGARRASLPRTRPRGMHSAGSRRIKRKQ